MSTVATLTDFAATRALSAASSPRADASNSLAAASSHDDLHRRLGEFVGGVFFAPMLQEMQKSPFKTKYSDGGRGEAAFAGQLALELSKRVGRAAADGFASKWIGNVARRVARDSSVKP